jgi:hypothetical protein
VRMFGVRITTSTLIPQNVKYWHSPTVKHLFFSNIIWDHPNWSVWMMKLIWESQWPVTFLDNRYQ